ncbi:hypothetical protein L596_001362 [Steinernema carpocapsae]|uniref:Uncharacterized protein n=1 Tax=Steinernema carpocapsae TaxID=34508 RepID=A0A4U8UL14_STECR|nr:hypothetical protein L596_001362 [Steinernema carpocapsae]
MAIRTFVVPARNTVLATGLLPRRRATLLHWRLRFIACGHIHVWRNVSCRTLRLCGPGQDWIQHNEVTLDATTSRFPCSSPKPDLERLLLHPRKSPKHSSLSTTAPGGRPHQGSDGGSRKCPRNCNQCRTTPAVVTEAAAVDTEEAATEACHILFFITRSC